MVRPYGSFFLFRSSLLPFFFLFFLFFVYLRVLRVFVVICPLPVARGPCPPLLISLIHRSPWL